MKRYFAAMAALGLLASASAYAQQAPSASEQQGQQAGQQGGQRQEVSPRVIKQLQARLHQQGYYDGKVTGNWDEDTSDALENFQEANGLQPSGELDGPTILVLAIPAGPPGQQQQATQSGPEGSGGQMGGPMMGRMMGGQMASGQTAQSERPMIDAYRAGFQHGFEQGLRQSEIMAARQGQGPSQGSSVPPQQYRGAQPQQFQGGQQ